MTISKKQLSEEKQLSFYDGLNQGKRVARDEIEAENKAMMFNAKTNLMREAAALATANAKLTYAMSQILEKVK